jgi:regulation of enolase protein 1 (concanavalin A-like superfamily)
MRYTFSAINVVPEAIPKDTDSFTLTAPPQTDLWRKPPGRDTSTAPVLFTSLRFPFVSAEVTVNADWRLEWDQAGLVIFAGAPPGQTVQPPDPEQAGANPPPYTPPASASATKWVKVGLEYSNNTCQASSTCASADSADWSITALPAYHTGRHDLRIKLERLGYALWIYYEDQLNGWTKLRELTGFFWGVDDKAIRVGVYASRPANFSDSSSPFDRGRQMEYLERDLSVEFEDLIIF